MGYNDYLKKVSDRVKIKQPLVREMMAESLGIFILLVFGNGSVAQSVLTNSANGEFISINWAYGIGVTMGVYISGGVSGAHLNPAVTLALAVAGKFPFWKVPFYMFAQLFGGFVSGAAVFSVYYDALNEFDGGVRQVLGEKGTGGIFCTYPQAYLTYGNGVWDQVFATALLVGIIFAINDKYNNKITDGFAPFLVGLLVFALGLSYGSNCGYAINPARDLGPRLFTWCAGWGIAVFQEPKIPGAWWWVPIVGPMIGGVLGAVVYSFLIGNNFPDEDEQDSSDLRSINSVNSAENDAYNTTIKSLSSSTSAL